MDKENNKKDRLQKILARAGYGSRRACERMIEAGRVTVDGRLASLGDQADPMSQRIEVDGVAIPDPQPRVYIKVYKPRGYITTTQDPQGRKTVLDLITLPRSQRGGTVRLYPVGRLDADSEGLLLLTNDGPLTQRLTHPKYEHPRVYRVLVEGIPDAETLERWQKGITLDGRPSRFDEVVVERQRTDDVWLRVTIHEGRKHLVRRIVAALGHPAKRLIRVAMGALQLGELRVGQWRYLTEAEVNALTQEIEGQRFSTACRHPRHRRQGRRGTGGSSSRRSRSSSTSRRRR
jgi:pseudouridine synthase